MKPKYRFPTIEWVDEQHSMYRFLEPGDELLGGYWMTCGPHREIWYEGKDWNEANAEWLRLLPELPYPRRGRRDFPLDEVGEEILPGRSEFDKTMSWLRGNRPGEVGAHMRMLTERFGRSWYWDLLTWYEEARRDGGIFPVPVLRTLMEQLRKKGKSDLWDVLDEFLREKWREDADLLVQHEKIMSRLRKAFRSKT